MKDVKTNLAHLQSDRDPDRQLLSDFAHIFGGSARKLLGATGWVVYVVGPELKIKHFLAADTSPAEMADYENNFAHLDPLSPANCILHNQFIACLNENLSLSSLEHTEYKSHFMQRHHITDALEIFLHSDAGITLGCSLLRHGELPTFSATDLRHAEGLKDLGDFTLTHLLPERLFGIEMIAERFPELTPRETLLMQLVAVGLSNKQMSDELNISLPTVKSHLLSIFRKLDVHSRSELTAKILL